jgi:hypothetical protein
MLDELIKVDIITFTVSKTLQISSNTTIKKLKELIETLLEIAVDSQKLLFDSKFLTDADDDKTLGEMGIIDGSTIQVLKNNLKRISLPHNSPLDSRNYDEDNGLNFYEYLPS